MSLRTLLFNLFIHNLIIIQSFAETNGVKNYSTDSVNILHYSIYLDLTNIPGKLLKGSARISMTSIYPSVHGVKLDLYKLQVDSVFYNSLSQPFFYDDTNIYICFPQVIDPQDTIMLEIYYHGRPVVESYGWGGFHFDPGPVVYNLGIALKDNPPNYARTWFPCIDNFTERADYDFFIKVKDPLVAVCNGTLNETLPQSGGTTIFHWRLKEDIPAYLASVAVSDYIALKDTFYGLNGMLKTFIYVNHQDSTKAVKSFIHLNQALKTYETRFGSYRWPRVGFVSTPIGAMEHVTNIAYPTAGIDGTLNSEHLYAHELSHMWFGDLVTCHSAADMWINEGWASFCEGIFTEGVYGVKAYRDYMRVKHHDVLKNTHHTDGDYYALAGIPPNLTYGSTVYDKGAMVVNTMRGYMGDALFFSTVKQYLDSFAHKDISSVQLSDFLTRRSGINMKDFFETWVFNPGFPHFSIDSVIVRSAKGPPYSVLVYVRQRSKGNRHVSNTNILEIGFAENVSHIKYDTLTFSGPTGSKTFMLDFIPAWTSLDPHEKIADATTDNYSIISTTGTVAFPQTYCSLEVTQLTDTALIRVIHNWVAPDPLTLPIPGLRLSGSRYWTIEGIIPDGFNAKGKFSYSKSGFLDDDILTNPYDSLVLLYRSSTATRWQFVSFVQHGNRNTGELVTDSIMKGEYCLGVWRKRE